MRDLFAYAVPLLSLLYAVVAHWRIKRSFWTPCMISALATGATAMLLYNWAGRGSATYLYVLSYSMITGLVLAILVGFLIKHVSRWLR